MLRSRVLGFVGIAALCMALAGPVQATSLLINGMNSYTIPDGSTSIELIVSLDDVTAVQQYVIDFKWDAGIVFTGADQLGANEVAPGFASRHLFTTDPNTMDGEVASNIRRAAVLSVPPASIRTDLAANIPDDDARMGLIALRFDIVDPIPGAQIMVGLLDERADFISQIGGGEVVLDNMGMTTASFASMPEPGTLALMGMSVLAAALRSRRA